jgi:hypothetical protein
MSSPTQRRLGRLVGQLQLGAPEICAASTNAARQKARRAKLRVNANDAQVDASPDQPLKGVLLLIVEMAMVSVIKIEPPGGEMWRKNGLPATGVDKRGEPFTVNFESRSTGGKRAWCYLAYLLLIKIF